MEFKFKWVLVTFLLACFGFKESSTDGVVYRSQCGSSYRSQTISDLHKKTPDFIEANGYIAETHYVTTEDGYVVTLHRIAGNQSECGYLYNQRPYKPAVLFHHGIASTSDNWILNGPQSFPFIMAKAGYDVWMGDCRGDYYSRRHVKLSAKDLKFWDFSFHEQGYYDLAAMTDYILGVTGLAKIFYVGHSRGTTMIFVLLSERPEFNDKFHLVVTLAPVAYLKHAMSPLLRTAFGAGASKEVQNFARNARVLVLPGISSRSIPIRQLVCGNGAPTQPLCLPALFLLSGFDYTLINSSRIPVYFAHYPDGGSFKEYVHYFQIAVSDEFRRFDYGPKKNIWVYGQQEPPEYNLARITAPLSLHYADNDFFVDQRDLDRLSSQLRSIVAKIRVPYDKFNHVDFVWGSKADVLVYYPTLELMNSFLRN